MAALWITNIIVTDPESYGKYAKLAGPAMAKHGGQFLARGGAFKQIEGKEYPRNVVVKFESIEAAEACYNSPEYQEALAFAKGASERQMVFVELTEDL